jgi:DNA-binding transcriptional MerR regulator
MVQIGEFSLITRIPVKTLRFYHEEGVLVPDWIDEETGYRYYRERSSEKAAVVTMLRAHEFTVAQIREIFENAGDDADLVGILEQRRTAIESRIARYRDAADSLDGMIETIRRKDMQAKKATFEITEKNIEDIIFLGIRYKGRYDQVGKYFGRIFRAAGRGTAGNAMTLYYDAEYMENEADIEAGVPVSKSISAEGMDCRVLKGGRAVTLIHKGPYETISEGYEKLFHYIADRKLTFVLPTHTVYLKGPGMILRGNPENYLTEIRVFVQ